MSRFSRTFAQLIRSGVPILEVLDIVGGASGNHVVETSIKGVSEDVEKGDNLSVALSKKPIFPPMMLRMVAAGEATGKIDTMLEKMADFWDEEIEAMLDALTSLIEPLLIVFLGVIVGGIVIAMFLPIFKLNEVVSQSKTRFRRAKAKEKPAHVWEEWDRKVHSFRVSSFLLRNRAPARARDRMTASTSTSTITMRRCSDAFHLRVHLAIDSLDRARRVFQHHVFLDHAGVDRERERRHHRQLQELPLERPALRPGIDRPLPRRETCGSPADMLRPEADAPARVARGHETRLRRSSSIASAFAVCPGRFRGTIRPVWATPRNCHFTNSDPRRAVRQIVLRVRAGKTLPQLLERQFLKPPQREQEPVIIDRGQRIAADSILHPQRHDPRQRVVRAASDERMEKIMRVIAFAVELDQHFSADRDFRDAELRAKQLHDRLRIGDRDLVILHQPIGDRRIVRVLRAPAFPLPSAIAGPRAPGRK